MSAAAATDDDFNTAALWGSAPERAVAAGINRPREKRLCRCMSPSPSQLAGPGLVSQQPSRVSCGRRARPRSSS